MAGGGVSWAQPWFAYVFLPIGVLALVGGIILLVTSQKNGQGAPVAAGAAAGMGSGKAPARGGRGPVEKRAVLRGVTGKYSGQSFDLLKGKVVIGRDPATCNIVFDKNTPGISGRHCQVVYDPNEDCFIITDLGSSYGTFLGNGKKLTANVAEKIVDRGHLLPVRQRQPVCGEQGVTRYGRVLFKKTEESRKRGERTPPAGNWRLSST